MTFAIVSGSAFAQKVPLGSVAPKVGATKVVQGRPLVAFERGKAYVLEFWATWCGACRPAIPHLNDLATKFAGRPLEIYSVSNESPAKIEPFLKLFPMRTNVVGGGDALSEALGADVLPTTILIDRAGRVAAITRPESVTEAALNDLLAGRKLSLPIANNKPMSLDWDKEIAVSSVGHVLFRYADSGGGGSRFVPGSGRVTADGIALQDLVRLAYDADVTDVRWEAPRDELRYRVSVKATDGKDATARTMLRDALRHGFGLRAEWRDVEREVVVLRAKGPVGLKATAGPSDQGFANGEGIVWPNATSRELARLLGTYGVRRTVVDETGLTGHYDLSLHWTPGDPEGAAKALAPLGLTLTRETRRVPTLVVRKADD